MSARLLSHFSHFPSFCILCIPSCSAFLGHSLPAVSYLFSPAGPSQETAPFFTSALMFVSFFPLLKTRNVSLYDPMHTHLSLLPPVQYSSVLQSVQNCLQFCIPPFCRKFEWVCIYLRGCYIDVHLSFSQWDIRDTATVFMVGLFMLTSILDAFYHFCGSVASKVSTESIIPGCLTPYV